MNPSDRRRVRAHSHRCPGCNGYAVERVSRRGAYELFVLPLLGRRPYRCLNCGRRFHDRRQR